MQHNANWHAACSTLHAALATGRSASIAERMAAQL
jgi:hypothetical protein